MSSGKTMGLIKIVWIVLVCFSVSALGQARADSPDTDDECINDHAQFIGKKDRKTIKGLCQKAKKDGVNMMVVTVKSLDAYLSRTMNLDNMVDDIFDEWDIEYDASNDAILLFVSRKERQIRIRMGDGYGDKAWKKAKHVMQRTVGPRLGRGASTAIRKGFARLYTEVAKPRIKTLKREEQAKKSKRGIVNFE